MHPRRRIFIPMNSHRRKLATLIRLTLVCAALAGAVLMSAVSCRRVPLTPPEAIRNLLVEQTPEGLEVSFEIIDAKGRPVAVMTGNGLIRIEDALSDTDTLTPGPLDSTRLLYNSQVYVDRTSFVHESAPDPDGRIQTTLVCRFGLFPYDRFLRAPSTRFGDIRVAVIPYAGDRLVQATARIEWGPQVFEAPVSSRSPRWR